MSAGLTIEQVLARSLRMPRRRLAAQSAIARTMDRAEANHQQQQQAQIADHTVNPTATAAMDSSPSAVIGSLTEGSTAASSKPELAPSSGSRGAEGRGPQPVSLPSETGLSSKRHQIVIPKEEPDPYPNRPMLRKLPHQGLARNCDDLLTHLVACKQLGDWKDALSVFAAHPKAMSVSRPHINALVETLVSADKAEVVEQMAHNNQFSSDSQTDLALRCTVTALNKRDKWKEALQVLSAMRQQPPPIEVYNEIVNACEATGAWREAMQIVFDLKDKHDRYITELSEFERAKDEEAAAKKDIVEEGKGGSGGSSNTHSSEDITVNISSTSPSHEVSNVPSSPAPKQLGPKPDAVTWTTLITILEKCGKEDLAQEVLKVVPPAERETILASYAALIYTWSQQKKRRF